MNRALLAIIAALGASGCVSVPPEQRVDHDPWESANRTMYIVNDAVDRVTTKPLAKGYNKILPTPVRQGVTNVTRNLMTPRSSLNNFLQGKPRDGVGELFRFIINSTIGVGGIFDIATQSGLEEHSEDFGQTAAVWGIPQGPFVILPFLGPRTLKDTVLLPLDIASDPLYHYNDRSIRTPFTVVRIINLRAQLLSFDEFLAESPDPYVTLRESWLQNREFEIYDGNPPVSEEEDDLFDEFFEEEDY